MIPLLVCPTVELIVFQTIFFITLILIISLFVVVILKGVKEKRNNDKAEILKRYGTVISKRIFVRSFTTYYVTFELDNSERKEFRVSAEKYGLLVENDYGLLTFQGTRFMSFERIK